MPHLPGFAARWANSSLGVAQTLATLRRKAATELSGVRGGTWTSGQRHVAASHVGCHLTAQQSPLRAGRGSPSPAGGPSTLSTGVLPAPTWSGWISYPLLNRGIPKVDLDDYQQKALGTDQRPEGEDAVIIPLLGLAGEAGTLLAEYKKFLRDGGSHLEYESLVGEELGDILWYVANLASKFNLSLSQVAEANLFKTNDRWNTESRSQPDLFDSAFPTSEQLPRQLTVTFSESGGPGRSRVIAKCGERLYGETLTDAAMIEDGYRYHDALHLAFATFLGWSPVSRRNLGCKRRSQEYVDETQDGGRAIVVEEAVAAHAYVYARRHNLLEGVEAIDFATLRTIRELTKPFEVSVRTPVEWQRALVEAFRIFRLLLAHRGGTVRCDLVHRSITFTPSS